MGEYCYYHKEAVKLGTCESLYYIRHGDLVRMIAAGEVEKMPGNDAPEAYLDGSYRFRFPFPDEDDLRPFTYQDYDRAFVVSVTGAGLLFTDEHYTVGASFQPRGGGYNVNVSLPCPQSADFDQVKSSGITWQVVEIVQQRPIDGDLWTVVRCPYCHAAWRLPTEEAVKLAACLVTHEGARYGREMARRVLAGYGLTLEEVEA